ncbi:YecA family protein [Sporosarcina trichiuri]|uniref:YecA family protein n=1 Tax=Sporosarcina trichiuri TaxID=3056445 RepID=UPI0025B5D0DA|nr:SEC-C metal-binding domain-containing protein [Sporosarcina sp. 0.2-SM1T-5]WJY28259.1 SEC-C metal-binding domain-containing protein [Sporosarcina sp. 0.2-SM1T-5]
MIGRNDPCPCGSGKKYKKCCETNEQTTVEAVKSEEIERTLQAFYDEYPKKKDFGDYREFALNWKRPLASSYNEEMIEAIALDEFFFHHRHDIWAGFVKKQLKKAIRPSIIRLLENWGTPLTLLGQVKTSDAETITVMDRLREKEVLLRKETGKPIPDGVHLWCFTLPEDKENGRLLAVSTLIFFPVDQQPVFEAFVSRFRAQSEEPEAFMAAQAVSLWEALAENGYEGEEFTHFEQGVLSRLAAFLEENGRDSGQLLDLVEDYLVEEQPNARKDAAVAAGAIRYGMESGLIEPLDLTVKAIAGSFEVSPSSLNRYYTGLSEYAERKK